ncbi:MAG: OFA family MFS transporter [archaeon]
MKRFTVVLGALAIQLCLGAIYAWSVFVNPLKELGFTTTQTQIIFSVALATFAIVMIFAGRWQDKAGPRKVAITGGAVLGLAYMLAGITGGSFISLVLTIGIIGGAGIGLTYVCPIAACVKWFPDHKGMITGLAVAGFGGGAWIFAQLSSSLIAAAGVLNTFLILGVIFLAVVTLGSLALVNPPKTRNKTAADSNSDMTWKQILRTRRFWFLWLMFTFGASAGLLVIGNLKPFGIFSGMTPAIAGSAVGILALFNAAGRIIWGTISDRLGRSRAMFLMFLFQGIMMLILMKMGANSLLLGIAAAWVGFNFGGNFALFPSATADFFGTKHLGINYGLVFTSYGVAGIIGPILGGRAFDLTGNYLYAFVPAGVLCLIAAALSLFTENR